MYACVIICVHFFTILYKKKKELPHSVRTIFEIFFSIFDALLHILFKVSLIVIDKLYQNVASVKAPLLV